MWEKEHRKWKIWEVEVIHSGGNSGLRLKMKESNGMKGEHMDRRKYVNDC